MEGHTNTTGGQTLYRFHDGHGMHVLHDHALVDHGRRRLESNCPTTLILGVEMGPLLRRMATGHTSVVRWSIWLLGRDIRVPPMSSTWLRTHEADSVKHAADV